MAVKTQLVSGIKKSSRIFLSLKRVFLLREGVAFQSRKIVGIE